MLESNDITIYLPHLTSQQLSLLENNDIFPENSNEKVLQSDWQTHFCALLGLSFSELPWSYLRAKQFDLDQQIATAVCCDPVLMQTTHRGAYLWGQQQLKFSKEEVIQIIAQINSQLMGEGESLYMLDNNQWLYTNQKQLTLMQRSFEDYIGKDMFGFSYQGSDGLFFDKLAVEIQMLIKQMIDYQGLQGVDPEMLVNVHFSSQDNLLPMEENIHRNNFVIITDDPLILSLCADLSIERLSISDYQESFANIEKEESYKKFVFYLTDETPHDELAIFKDCFKQLSDKKVTQITLVTQDKSMTYRLEKSFLNKLFSWLKRPDFGK